MSFTIYLCADATLTYGPLGGQQKIIKQALPVCEVESEEEANDLITLTGSLQYGENQDYPTAPREGYGPPNRMRYTLEDFRRGSVDCLFDVRDTMEALRDARRGPAEEYTEKRHAIFNKAREKGLGLTATAEYDEEG